MSSKIYVDRFPKRCSLQYILIYYKSSTIQTNLFLVGDSICFSIIVFETHSLLVYYKFKLKNSLKLTGSLSSFVMQLLGRGNGSHENDTRGFLLL